MKKIAMILAGGTGQRVGAEIPKQFLKVCGKEIIIHTLELFEHNQGIDEIYIACKEEWIPYLKKLLIKYEIDKVAKIFEGGTTRLDSIFSCLTEAKKDNEDAIILIHDGVRPLITQDTINNCLESVEQYGTAITVNEVFETPIMSFDGESVGQMPQRNKCYTAQAPQGFLLNDLYNLHLQERQINPGYEGLVDSCGLMFKYGINCHLVKGNRGNIKVTTPEDFYTLLSNLNMRDYEQIALLKENENAKTLKRTL